MVISTVDIFIGVFMRYEEIIFTRRLNGALKISWSRRSRIETSSIITIRWPIETTYFLCEESVRQKLFNYDSYLSRCMCVCVCVCLCVCVCVCVCLCEVCVCVYVVCV